MGHSHEWHCRAEMSAVAGAAALHGKEPRPASPVKAARARTLGGFGLAQQLGFGYKLMRSGTETDTAAARHPVA